MNQCTDFCTTCSYWNAQRETDDSGKLLMVELPADGKRVAYHHIFFDDNIERDRAHIVDARNAATGEAIPFAKTYNVFLMRALPVQVRLRYGCRGARCASLVMCLLCAVGAPRGLCNAWHTERSTKLNNRMGPRS